MDSTRLAPTLGIAASLAVLFVLTLPYAIVEAGSAVATYYAAGDVNGLFVGLFAVVSVIVFAAGREERSPPDLVAGVTLVLGTFTLVLAALWALTVPGDLVAQLTTETLLQYHRGAVVVLAALVPASAVWYARSLRIF